jgi:ketosteroid isomerase-like protein
MSVEEVALQFVDAINHADINRLAALITNDHTFVDSDGSKIIGQEAVLAGWSQYFSMMRDYRVTVHETFSSGKTVILVGTATGIYAGNSQSYPENHWTVPAAWRAVTEAIGYPARFCPLRTWGNL